MKHTIISFGFRIVLALALVFGLTVSPALGGDSLGAGDVAPDFTVTTLDGKTVNLSDYQGTVVFLNFWASWCPPCRAEMPSIESLKDQMSGYNFVVLAVSVDSGNKDKVVNKVQKYIEENDFSFEVLIDNEMTVARSYGITSVPTTFILDDSGVIVEVSRGAEYWDDAKRLSQFRTLSSLVEMEAAEE